jgi:hypothetical protein
MDTSGIPPTFLILSLSTSSFRAHSASPPLDSIIPQNSTNLPFSSSHRQPSRPSSGVLAHPPNWSRSLPPCQAPSTPTSTSTRLGPTVGPTPGPPFPTPARSSAPIWTAAHGARACSLAARPSSSRRGRPASSYPSSGTTTSCGVRRKWIRLGGSKPSESPRLAVWTPCRNEDGSSTLASR